MMSKFVIRYIDERIDRDTAPLRVYITTMRAAVSNDQICYYANLTTHISTINTPKWVTIISVNDRQVPPRYEVRTAGDDIKCRRLVGFVVTEGITADDFTLVRV
jgi:hypothetical protein